VGGHAVDGGTAELVQWTLTDHLNTVRDIAKYNPGSDMTTVVNHLVYDAFGRVTSESNPAVDSLFLFTGRPFDSDTRLQSNINRWYDAHVGRWLSEDPIGFAGGDGNLYRYVGNAPASVSDPTALACWITYECHLLEEWKSPKTGNVYCKYSCRDVARRTRPGGIFHCKCPPLDSIPDGGISGIYWKAASRGWLPWSRPFCPGRIVTGDAFDFTPERERLFPIVDFKECVSQCGNVERAKKLCDLIKEPTARTACKAAMQAGAAACEAYCHNFQKPIGSVSGL